jgi:hypothetical protein
MADPTPVETATPAPATTPAPPEDAPPKKYESMEQIFEEIRERAGIGSFLDVPRAARACWVDPDHKAMLFKIGEESPFGAKDTVLGIFHDDAEIRVFTLPKERGELKRYCLSKQSPVFVLDTFSDLDMWIDEMADEFALLVGEEDDEETPPTNGATTTS